MSPYIVTTRGRWTEGGNSPVVLSRRAVATRYEVWDTVPAEARKGLIGMTESGGTVGPLPDGTVIEVAHANWDALDPAWDASDTVHDLVARFNAQETRA